MPILKSFKLWSHTDWHPGNAEPSVWGDQQQQQLGSWVYPLQSGKNVWAVDRGWFKAEEEQQQHKHNSDEGIFNPNN